MKYILCRIVKFVDKYGWNKAWKLASEKYYFKSIECDRLNSKILNSYVLHPIKKIDDCKEMHFSNIYIDSTRENNLTSFDLKNKDSQTLMRRTEIYGIIQDISLSEDRAGIREIETLNSCSTDWRTRRNISILIEEELYYKIREKLKNFRGYNPADFTTSLVELAVTTK